MTQQNQLSTFLILPEIFTPSNYEPGGREFESLRARQCSEGKGPSVSLGALFFFELAFVGQ